MIYFTKGDKWRRALLTGGALLVSASLSATAHAQSDDRAPAATAAENDSTQEDITVTALKRNLSAQKTPATVAIVPGDLIAKTNVTSALDLPAITPGLIIQSAPGALAVAAIRGIGTNASNQSFDQSVALFVDGVFTARGRDYASSLFDVSDIQVIKGSQSAVLGKNTTIGAIAMNTNRPVFDFGYNASYSHELAVGGDTFDAMINIPLSGNFAIRAAGRITDLDGWVKNDLMDNESPRVVTRAGRISLRWKPSSSFDWSASYQHETYKSDGQVLYVAGDTLGRVATYAAAAGDPNFSAAFDDHTRATPRPGFPDTFAKNASHRLISTLTYDLEGGFELTSITSYFKSTGSLLNNNNAVANAPVIFFADRAGDRTFSQEVRLSTPEIGIFSLLAGGLYYNNIYNFDVGFDAVAPSPIVGAERTRFRQKTVDWSGFVSLDARISDRFVLTGSVRYTTEKRGADYARDIIRNGNLIAAIYRPFAPISLSRSKGYLDASASAKFNISDNAIIYASYGKGSKTGGFANAPNDPTLLRPDGHSAAEYKDEVAKTAEAGIKVGRASGTHLNVAVFNVDVDDFQTSLFSGTTFIVKNIDIRSRGVEFEAMWRPVDALTFAVSGTYADAINKRPAANERHELVRAPKFTGIASISYQTQLSSALKFSANANAELRSGFFFQDALNSTVPETDTMVKLGLRFGIEHKPSGIEFALIGRNLTDRRVPNYGTGLFPGIAGAYLASSEPPRTIALQLTIRR
jgi:iron complex outermembrane receptor protein